MDDNLYLFVQNGRLFVLSPFTSTTKIRIRSFGEEQIAFSIQNDDDLSSEEKCTFLNSTIDSKSFGNKIQ